MMKETALKKIDSIVLTATSTPSAKLSKVNKLWSKKLTLMTLLLLSLLSISGVYAADGLSMSAFTLTTASDGSQEYSVTLQILIFMTALSFIPAAVIMMTSFTRIVVVLAILRQAFGYSNHLLTKLLLA